MTLDDPIGKPFKRFCLEEDISDPTGRKMIRQGDIRVFRIGKKLMVEMASYREFIARQQAEGVPPYDGTLKAQEATGRTKGASLREVLEEEGLVHPGGEAR